MDQLFRRLDKLLQSKDHVVLAVSGFGGSGKTTLSEKIRRKYSDSTWVQLDNFLINHGQGEGWAGGYDWGRFEQVLKDIKAGKDLHYQAYDWHKDALTDWYINEELPKLVIVEGVRILQQKLLPYFDLTVWIDSDLETATNQGIARDRENWENKSDNDGLEAHLSNWEAEWAPKDKEFFEKFRPDKTADFVIKLS